MSANSLISNVEIELIKVAIGNAELLTSGEIRVHIESKCKTDPLEKAILIFQKLNMHHTKLRNGVLIFIALNDRKFSIVGDQGIYSKVEPDFWNSTKKLMQEKMSSGQMIEGIITGIKEAALQLQKYFPSSENNKNELSNDITFEND